MYNLAPWCYRACWLVEKPEGQGSNIVSGDRLGDMGQTRVGPSPPNIAHGHAKQGQDGQRHQPTLQECHPSGIILSCSPAIASPLPQDLIPSWLLGLRCHRVLGKSGVSQSRLDFCRKGISVCNSID